MEVLVESLFNAMHEQLKISSSMLAFVQARVSAESFVRNECALAAFNSLDSEKYHVHMEKRYKGKTVDLLIHKVENGIQTKEPAYQFELKMAWPGGLDGNAAGVNHDLAALQGRENAWALVLFFAFEKTDKGCPYQPTKMSFEDGLGQFVRAVEAKAGPRMWNSSAFDMISGNSVGKACLMAWPAATPV
jgi:hypothetical protein